MDLIRGVWRKSGAEVDGEALGLVAGVEEHLDEAGREVGEAAPEVGAVAEDDGALVAARHIAGKRPGLYDMTDVLGA